VTFERAADDQAARAPSRLAAMRCRTLMQDGLQDVRMAIRVTVSVQQKTISRSGGICSGMLPLFCRIPAGRPITAVFPEPHFRFSPACTAL
jgi:hypothetical protein